VAASQGIKTVAEFVNTKVIIEHAKAIGIDYAQGYLLHKPENIDAVLA